MVEHRAFGGRNKERDNVWWHGSVNGDMRGGRSGLHLGTKAAAEDALYSRIGFPAEGDWDGTREYGKTLLAGKKTILKRNEHGITGRNVDAPDEDYYAHEHPQGSLKHWNDEPVDPTVKPSIKPFRIVGKMTNTISNPHNDWKANGYMQAALKKGNAKNGYFYKNEGEDSGSISAVVPNGSHVEPIEEDDIKKADGGALTDDEGITAYHGSPHDFERFDTSKIGTGEGAQAYGHGLYFAGNEDVAEGYRNRLSGYHPGSVKIGGEEHPHWSRREVANAFAKLGYDPQTSVFAAHLINEHQGDLDSAVNSLFDFEPEDEGKFKETKKINDNLLKALMEVEPVNYKGHMYEVHINAHPDHMLDWDAPLSEQHPDVWQKLVRGPSFIKDAVKDGILNGKTYGDIHGTIVAKHPRGQQGVSEHLSEMGIPGIKYLDAGSRTTTDKPTRNYVVFDHNNVDVKRKYEHGGRIYPLRNHTDWEEAHDYEKTGGKLHYETPDHYLDQVKPLDMDHDDKHIIHHFEKQMKKGEKLDPVAIYPNGHPNGRHRAEAAKKLGIKKLPVVDWEKKKGGGSIVNRALMVISKKV